MFGDDGIRLYPGGSVRRSVCGYSCGRHGPAQTAYASNAVLCGAILNCSELLR